jgi:hypothetical protein
VRFAVAGCTTTLATGTAVTPTVAVPLFPSLTAVIVAEPTAMPVTTPVGDTVATDGLSLVHVTTRSVTTMFLPSRTVAVSDVVWPTAIEVAGGLTATLATGEGVTVSATPLLTTPSLVAVMAVVPGVTAVTTPVVEIVATAGLLELHATSRSVTTTSFAFLTTAVAVVVWPTVRFDVGICTVTLPTGTTVTVTSELPLLPPTVALMVAGEAPGATAVTTAVKGPLEVTVATSGLLVVHVTVRSTSTFPAASFTVAVNVVA